MSKSTKRFIVVFALVGLFSFAGCDKANRFDPNKAQVYISTAQAVNAATAPVNPYSPIIEIGLATLVLVIGAWGKAKSAQASTATTTLGSVVQAVERVAGTTKDAIKDEVASNLAAANITTEGKALISASKNP